MEYVNKSSGERMTVIKNRIRKLINDGKVDVASTLLDDYMKLIPNDPDAFSMKAMLYLLNNDTDEAQKLLDNGLKVFPENVDLLFNLGYVYEQAGNFKKAVHCYHRLLQINADESIRKEVQGLIDRIRAEHGVSMQNLYKIVFFVKQGLDNFIDDIIEGLSHHFEVKKIIVTQYKQIDEGMQWADICWFEWCDELIIYGSKLELAKKRKIICRLHRYEAFSEFPLKVQWDCVDKVIFVSKHIRDIVLEKTNLDSNRCIVIPNGINAERFKYRERSKGYNIACIGYLNVRKNPMLLLQCFYEIVKEDKNYQLFFAGSFQDETLFYYMKDMIIRLGIEKNIHFDGFIPNDKIAQWLEPMNYIVTSSIAEGHPVGVMEAMSCGLKPAIHYFPGAEEFYPKKYIYYNIDDFRRIIKESEYNSKEYHSYIADNFSFSTQLKRITEVIGSLLGVDISHFSYENKPYSINKEIVSDKTQDKNEVREYYDNFLSYLKKDREKENPRHTYIKNRLSQIIKKNDKVLDLGCGIGITTEHIKSLNVSKVIGVDLSPELINHAKSIVKDVEFIVHDITNVSIDDKFDVITLCDVIEHIPRDRYKSLFGVIKKHLKKQGIVYISVPDFHYQNFVWKYRPELMQIIDNCISYEEINNLCNEFGLKIRFYNCYGVFLNNQYNEYILCDKEAYEAAWDSLRHT